MNTKKIIACIAVASCLFCSAVPVFAKPVERISAGEFGELKGELPPSTAHATGSRLDYYEICATTTVKKSPGKSARVIARIEIKNNSTGKLIHDETFPVGTNGALTAGYYVNMAELGAYVGENKTYGVFGTHEARYTKSYAVYTTRTYNLKRDHGIG